VRRGRPLTIRLRLRASSRPRRAGVLRRDCSSFLERQRTRGPAPAVQKLSVPIDLHFYTPLSVVAEFAIQLPAILLDGSEVFAGPRLARRRRAVGRVERFVAHHRSAISARQSRHEAQALVRRDRAGIGFPAGCPGCGEASPQ
jgi:hypothetical protein